MREKVSDVSCTLINNAIASYKYSVRDFQIYIYIYDRKFRVEQNIFLDSAISVTPRIVNLNLTNKIVLQNKTWLPLWGIKMNVLTDLLTIRKKNYEFEPYFLWVYVPVRRGTAKSVFLPTSPATWAPSEWPTMWSVSEERPALVMSFNADAILTPTGLTLPPATK